jgi:hypothetical protein
MMPHRDWSEQRERQYEHIKQSAQQRGQGARAAEIAARTVNKERSRTGEVSARTSRGGAPSGRRGVSGAPSGRTKEQLYDEAKRRDIQGRSTMTKAELERALGR